MDLRPCRISSAVHSTALPPLRRRASRRRRAPLTRLCGGSQAPIANFGAIAQSHRTHVPADPARLMRRPVAMWGSAAWAGRFRDCTTSAVRAAISAAVASTVSPLRRQWRPQPGYSTSNLPADDEQKVKTAPETSNPPTIPSWSARTSHNVRPPIDATLRMPVDRIDPIDRLRGLDRLDIRKVHHHGLVVGANQHAFERLVR